MIELQDQETLICVARKHWLIFAVEGIGIVFASFVPLIAILFQPDIQGSFGNYGLLFSTLYWMVLVLMLYVELLRLWLDTVVVTDKRIIITEQYSLFNREVSEFTIDKIQDVSVETKGITPSLFGFGTVIMQTAGERFFTVTQIEKPDQLKSSILEIARKSEVR